MAQPLDLDDTVATLSDRLQGLIQKSGGTKRIIVALAGVPGSGKSTVSSALLSRLSQDGMTNVAVLPMDGFHLTKATLSKFSDPDEAFRRRGAPFTFDAQGFVELVGRLKQMPVTEGNEPEHRLTAPGFDHAVGDPVPNAIVLESTCRAVIVEGNYTLLQQAPWKEIASLAAEKWFVDVPRDIAKARLVARHLAAGISSNKEEATRRVEENDLPNDNHVALTAPSQGYFDAEQCERFKVQGLMKPNVFGQKVEE